MTDFADNSSQTLYFAGLAMIQSGDRPGGEKLVSQALQKENNNPEIYYWLGLPTESAELSSKYLAQCSIKAPRFIERDPNSCGHLVEVRKWTVEAKAKGATPTPKKKDVL